MTRKVIIGVAVSMTLMLATTAILSRKSAVDETIETAVKVERPSRFSEGVKNTLTLNELQFGGQIYEDTSVYQEQRENEGRLQEFYNDPDAQGIADHVVVKNNERVAEGLLPYKIVRRCGQLGPSLKFIVFDEDCQSPLIPLDEWEIVISPIDGDTILLRIDPE